MEVHHHPRLDHNPKPWKEYLLEGLMIFLAVTMGFFAESLRERIADHQKEKEAMVSLVRDLKKDTAVLNNLIKVYMPTHNRWADSADQFINSLSIKGNEQKLTMALFNATSWATYTPPEIALNNLKSSGAFDLITKDKVKAEILNFNSIVNVYTRYSEFLAEVEHKVDTANTSLITRKVQREAVEKLYLSNGKNDFGFVDYKSIPANIIFKTYNKAVFMAYLKHIDEVDNLLNDMLGQYKAIFAEEVKLLTIIQEEYHLKDEQ
ncbi:MAG TPA: hypothetical protein VL442_05775 [Mucilaginibacter sp.]|jgi:hypothetical protein|nr:hypothetical protein [Mucilaginibacter sp.]